MEPCRQETTIEMIRDDLKEIKADVKTLLEFKYRWLGRLSVFSTIFLIGLTVLSRVVK